MTRLEPTKRRMPNSSQKFKDLGRFMEVGRSTEEVGTQIFFGAIEVYEISATICNLTAGEKSLGIQVMLEKVALSYYASHTRNRARTYGEAIQMLKSGSDLRSREHTCSKTGEIQTSPSGLMVSGDIPVSCISRNVGQAYLYSAPTASRLSEAQVFGRQANPCS